MRYPEQLIYLYAAWFLTNFCGVSGQQECCCDAHDAGMFEKHGRGRPEAVRRTAVRLYEAEILGMYTLVSDYYYHIILSH